MTDPDPDVDTSIDPAENHKETDTSFEEPLPPSRIKSSQKSSDAGAVVKQRRVSNSLSGYSFEPAPGEEYSPVSNSLSGYSFEPASGDEYGDSPSTRVFFWLL